MYSSTCTEMDRVARRGKEGKRKVGRKTTRQTKSSVVKKIGGDKKQITNIQKHSPPQQLLKFPYACTVHPGRATAFVHDIPVRMYSTVHPGHATAFVARNECDPVDRPARWPGTDTI